MLPIVEIHEFGLIIEHVQNKCNGLKTFNELLSFFLTQVSILKIKLHLFLTVNLSIEQQTNQ